MKRFLKGFSYNRIGYRYFLENKALWKYALIPLTLNFLALVLLVSLYVEYFDVVFSFVAKPLLGLDIQDPAGFWLNLADACLWVVRNFLKIIFFLLTLVINFVVVYLLIGLVNAPFYELLSERVLILKGRGVGKPFSWRVFLREVIYSLKIEALKTGLYIGVSLLFFLLGLIPMIGVVASFLGFVFTAWFMALGLCLYPMILNRAPFQKILSWSLQNKLMLIGFGLPALIPFVGLFIVHFQVVGGALIWIECGAPARGDGVT